MPALDCRCLLVLAVAGCATGPRPMPAESTAEERLARAEAALSTAKGVTGTFEVESAGARASKLTGTLDFAAPNAVLLSADGTFGADTVHVELDSRKGEAVSRTLTKGSEASAHQDPMTPALGEAVAVGLSRMGLLHNLARLIGDEPVDRADGTAREWLKVLEPKDAGPDTIGTEPCHRVSYTLEVALKRAAEMTVCISDATSLPLERKATVHLGDGEMQVTERYRWTVR